MGMTMTKKTKKTKVVCSSLSLVRDHATHSTLFKLFSVDFCVVLMYCLSMFAYLCDRSHHA